MANMRPAEWQAAQVDSKPISYASASTAGVTAAQENRFRLVLSDGEHAHAVPLAAGLNHLAESGRLVQGSVLLLENYLLHPLPTDGSGAAEEGW